MSIRRNLGGSLVVCTIGLCVWLAADRASAELLDPADAAPTATSPAPKPAAKTAPKPAEKPSPDKPAAGPAKQPPTDTAKPPVVPPVAPPETTPADELPLRPRSAATFEPLLHLASIPNMFGDSFGSAGQLAITGGNFEPVVDLPLAGAVGRMKIAENDKALPMDRVFFNYNHYHNAFDADLDVTSPRGGFASSLDVFTLGAEKTFRDGDWSLEVRMPFASDFDVRGRNFSVNGGEVGNLWFAAKRLLAVSECGAIVAGLAIDTPTGSDVHGQFDTTSFTVRNDAVYLGPFLGALYVPNDYWFYQGFLQVDVAANGNRVDWADSGDSTSGSFGRVTPQTLMYVDLSAGRWLFRNPEATLTGLAAVMEFHYATSLNQADVVRGTAGNLNMAFGNLLGHIDVPNLTLGLHAELNGHTDVRFGAVLPLVTDAQRQFDAEVQLSLNRRF